MNYFTALKDAEFAHQLLSTAGLDLSALRTAGDIEALKTRLTAAAGALSKEQATQLQSALAEATTENAALSTQLAEAKRQVSVHAGEMVKLTEAKAAAESKLTALAEALKPVGLDLAACSTAEGALDPAKLTAALKSTAHLKACELLATTGGAPLEETPAADASKPAAKAKPAANASRAEHWAYCHSLPVAEQSAYFRQHLQAGSPQSN